jgi:hypothetical protein
MEWRCAIYFIQRCAPAATQKHGGNTALVHLPVLLAKVPDAHAAQTAEDEAPAAANATLETTECHLQAFVKDGHLLMCINAERRFREDTL